MLSTFADIASIVQALAIIIGGLTIWLRRSTHPNVVLFSVLGKNKLRMGYLIYVSGIMKWKWIYASISFLRKFLIKDFLRNEIAGSTADRIYSAMSETFEELINRSEKEVVTRLDLNDRGIFILEGKEVLRFYATWLVFTKISKVARKRDLEDSSIVNTFVPDLYVGKSQLRKITKKWSGTFLDINYLFDELPSEDNSITRNILLDQLEFGILGEKEHSKLREKLFSGEDPYPYYYEELLKLRRHT